jgi:hypothetical protein
MDRVRCNGDRGVFVVFVYVSVSVCLCVCVRGEREGAWGGSITLRHRRALSSGNLSFRAE